MVQAFSLGALTAAQLILGLLIQIVVIAILGVGQQTDAWVAAQAVPLVLFGIAAIAGQGAWQAEFVIASSDRPSFLDKQRCAHGQLLMGLGGTIVLLALSADLWTAALFSGFTASQKQLTSELSLILLCSTLLNAHGALFTTAMRARNLFVLPEAIAAAGSVLAILLTALFVPRVGVIAAAWASLARTAFISSTLFVLSGRALPSFRAALGDGAAWRRMKPLLLSYSIAKSGPLVDRFLGSLAPAGGLTTFNLALTGMNALASVLERSFGTVPTTAVANLVKSRDHAGIRRTYRLCLTRAAWSSAAVLLALLVIAPFWARMTHAAIGLEAAPARDLWWYCVLLCSFLVPASAGTAITFSFYAFGDTVTPARVATIGFLLSIGVKAIGFYLFGIVGIVIGILIHYIANLAVLCWLLERRLRREQVIDNPSIET